MAIIPNIVNMVSGINQRRRAGRVRSAMENYLDDPEAATQEIMADDPDYARALMQERRQQTLQDQDRNRALFADGLSYLRGVDDPNQRGGVIDALSPQLRQGGMTTEGLESLRMASSGPGNVANRRDPDAWKAEVEQKYTPYTIQAGQKRAVGGEEVDRGEYAMQTLSIPTADGGVEVVLFDRNKGEFVTEDGGPVSPEVAQAAAAQVQAQPGTFEADFDQEFGTGQPAAPTPLTVDNVREHFIAQESSGDYTAKNKETGALGAYQVMPETGLALAKRLGVPWRPDLMTSNTKQARAYQDKIGGAAIQEAIDNSGGDPRTMAMYYHGGSNRKIWGPRTQKYGDDMTARVGGGGGGQPAPAPRKRGGVQVRRTGISSAGANQPGRFRAATRAEVAAMPGVQSAQIDTQTGKMVNVVRTPAPKGPTATSLKDQRKQESQAEAKRMTTNVLSQMADDYVRLSNMDGAIVDSRRGAGNNIEAWINSSSLGQAISGAFGSDAQSIRQQINQSRPLLLNQVRQASEMGARGLDSNKELEFYLQAATDPGRELLANFAAIHILDTAYGNGDALARSLPPELFKIVSSRARSLASEQGSGYLFENTGRSGQKPSASSGWGEAKVVD